MSELSFGVTTDDPPDYPQRKSPGDSLLVGQLRSAPHIVGRIGSVVLFSASFHIFAVRMLLHSVGGGVISGGFSLGVISGECLPGVSS